VHAVTVTVTGEVPASYEGVIDMQVGAHVVMLY